jgi:hypothetical protein
MKTCNRCGAEGLVWRKSKAGNWYLAIETSVGGKRGGHLTIFPAHKCEYQETDPTARADAKNSAMIDAGYAGII